MAIQPDSYAVNFREFFAFVRVHTEVPFPFCQGFGGINIYVKARIVNIKAGIQSNLRMKVKHFKPQKDGNEMFCEARYLREHIAKI